MSFSDFILDGLPEAVVVALENGSIVRVNPAATRLLGYGPEDIKGKDLTLLVPIRADRRADPLKWIERWAAAPSDTEPRFIDLIAQTRDGKEMPLSVRVRKADFDGTGHFLITFRDVTEMRARESEQRNAALLATRILQIAEDAIISIDQDQKIIYANAKAEETFGYTTTELLGQGVEMLLPEQARAGHAAQVETFGRSKLPSKLMSGRGEIEGLNKSGQAVPLEASITNVSVGGTTTYTAHLRDISQRKAAQQALAQSELRARAVFENAFQAMALLDADGKVLEINPAAVALTTGGDARGLGLWELPWVFLDEAARETGQTQLRDAVVSGSKGQTTRFVGEVANPDGSNSQIDFNLIPVKDDAGKVLYMLAEGRDITSL